MKIAKSVRPVAFGAASLLAVGLIGVVATSAHAATIGNLTFVPGSGNLDTSITVTTDKLCSGGTNIQARIEGTGFPSGGQQVTQNYSQTTVTTGSGYTVPLLDTLRNIANLVSPPVSYSGTYTVTLSCKNAFGAANFGDFVGTISFSNPSTWAAANTNPSPSPSATPSVSTSPGSSPSPSVSPSSSPSPSVSPSASPSPSVSPSSSPSPTVSTSPSTSPSSSPSPTTSTGGGTSVNELLNVSVPAGSLVLSATSATVALPELKLNSGFTQYSTAGALANVAVTDTRAGAPGFTVSGQASAFTGGGSTIDPSNLGWAPKVVSAVGASVTPGPVVSPGTGLATPKTLATGTGLGTAVLGADLSLVAPITTKAGAYSSTLTITAI